MRHIKKAAAACLAAVLLCLTACSADTDGNADTANKTAEDTVSVNETDAAAPEETEASATSQSDDMNGDTAAMTATTVFSIIDFGAIADGVTDCTAAVQAALDAAAECSGTVTVPAGTYLVGQLKMGKGVSLEGTPAWSFRNYGASIFKLNDASAKCMIDITGAVGCRIYGMSLDGSAIGDGIHGVMLSWSESNGGGTEDTPTIDECRIGDFTGDGVHFNNVWCFSLRHSMLCFNGGAGLYINGWDGFILDNWFSGNSGGGINGGWYTASLSITGNRVEWNRKYGFCFQNGDNFTICGNFFDRSYGPGLILGALGKTVDTVSVTGNVFRYNGDENVSAALKFNDSHIYMRNCVNAVISGNSMLKGTTGNSGSTATPSYAIYADTVTGSVISANALYNAATVQSIYTAGDCADTIISDNSANN